MQAGRKCCAAGCRANIRPFRNRRASTLALSRPRSGVAGCFLDELHAGAQAEFGGGIHYCLGAHLARAELAEALTVITRRMPNPRRSGPAPWKPLMGITGPASLPIEFDAGH
jgi:cytochrome P450